MSDEDKPSDVVTEARKRFQRAQTYYSAARQLAIADTQFAMGDSDNGWQWPALINQQRTAAKKVVLTVNLTAQHCNQVINQIRQNKPSATVSPADDGADKKTAEILAGLLRNIQTVSRADDAHDVAAEHAIYGGEGYWRVYTDFESPASFNQRICIGALPNPNLVYVDPDCRELDRSDAMWGFIFEDIGKEQFKREYPDIEPGDWSGDAIKEGWVQDDTYRIAEYFYCELVKDTAILLDDGQSILKSALPLGAQLKEPTKGTPGLLTGADGTQSIVIKTRATTRKQWKWCKLVGGHDKPVDERDWPGDWLPIITVVGKELNVNGQIVRKGLVRDLKDPARMANYAFSETVQTIALQNKTPYMAATEAIEGFESNWQSANLDTQPYLPFNAFDDEGKPLPMPSRQPPPVMPAAQVQLLGLSTEQMRAASGQQNANFGIRSEAQSGVGIERLKVQGEVATFHFPDNLRRALQYEAKVVIDLIQKVYDTRRVVRILGLDGKEEIATLDPDAQQPYAEQQIDEDVRRIFNPMLGEYDVVINTGPTFQTQRQEAFATLTELASRDPRVMQIAGDLVMKAADFPMADELAQRFEKTLPPQLQEQKGGEAQQLQQAMGQLQQAGQALEAMQQHIQQLEGELAKVNTEARGRVAVAQVQAAADADKNADDHAVAVYKAETERMQALAPAITPEQIQMIVMQTVREVLASPPLETPEPEPPPGALPEVTEPPPGGFFSPTGGAEPGLPIGQP